MLLQFRWFLTKSLVWLLLNSFDFRSSALTARCPSVVVAVAQMSRFKGSGLGARGVPKWNLPPCGPGDFVWERVCTAAARKDGPASSPYINHHMSSSLNKMERLLCFPWKMNYNKSVWVLPSPWQFLSVGSLPEFCRAKFQSQLRMHEKKKKKNIYIKWYIYI